MDNEFDLRQLRQMRSLINQMLKRQIGVSRFVSDQWALVEMLKSIDQQWKEEYFFLVNLIEDMHAAALDLGQTQMDKNDAQKIDENLKKMLILLDARNF